MHSRLHASVPDSAPGTGLVHGDFYQNNWMASDGRLTAILDWESGHLGPTSIDVGYVAMMYDAASWDPALRTDLVDVDRPEHLLDRYASAAGAPVCHAAWFRALAGLRLGALTAYFVRLHRALRAADARPGCGAARGEVTQEPGHRLAADTPMPAQTSSSSQITP